MGGRAVAGFGVDRIVALLLTTGLAVTTARLLGPAGRGQFALALLTATGLGEVAAGGNWLAARYRAIRATEDQWQGAVVRSRWFSVALALPAGAAMAIGYGSVALGVATALVLCATTAAALSRGWAIAHEHLRAYSRSLLLPGVGALVGVGLLHGAGFGSPSLALAGWAVGLVLARRQLARARCDDGRRVAAGEGSRGPFDGPPSSRAHLGLGISSLLLSFLGYRIDYYVVQLLGTAADLGRYSVGVALAELVLVPHSLVATIYASRTARSGEGGDTARPLPFLLVDLATVAVLGAAVALGGPYVLRVAFGGAYAEAASVLPYLIPGLAASGAVAILTIHLNVISGSYGTSIVASLANAAVTVVLASVLVPGYGIVGAAVGSSVGYAAGLAVAAFAVWRGGKPAGPSPDAEPPWPPPTAALAGRDGRAR